MYSIKRINYLTLNLFRQSRTIIDLPSDRVDDQDMHDLANTLMQSAVRQSVLSIYSLTYSLLHTNTHNLL